MSWTPFVGMFIARISKGRTIREFVLGVLVAPTLVSALWFTVFGESAILRQLLTGDMAPERVVDTSTSLFILLGGLPWSTLTSLVAIAVIALQTAAIVTAVPVSIVMGVAAISLLRAFRFEVATTANYLRIVGSSDAIPLEVGRVVADGQPGEDPAMVVAFHSLRPTSVEVDENTSTVQLVPEPYGVDPLRANGNGTANGVD